jgi:hypothetical protein
MAWANITWVILVKDNCDAQLVECQAGCSHVRARPQLQYQASIKEKARAGSNIVLILGIGGLDRERSE